jgi:hypothetical protein
MFSDATYAAKFLHGILCSYTRSLLVNDIIDKMMVVLN